MHRSEHAGQEGGWAPASTAARTLPCSGQRVSLLAAARRHREAGAALCLCGHPGQSFTLAVRGTLHQLSQARHRPCLLEASSLHAESVAPTLCSRHRCTPVGQAWQNGSSESFIPARQAPDIKRKETGQSGHRSSFPLTCHSQTIWK